MNRTTNILHRPYRRYLHCAIPFTSKPLNSHARTVLKMSRYAYSKLDTAPPLHRISASDVPKQIEKEAYRKAIDIQAACVPASKTGKILRAESMRGTILDLPKLSSVVPGPSETQRLVLLRAAPTDALPPNVSSFLAEEGASLVPYSISLDYSYWTADEILQVTLPEELCDGSPTGFAITGHIAHFNLRDDYLPFKGLIGQAIIDKNKRVRTVVNKLDNIHNQFRFFDMELMAGEPEYVVEHHESDCRFTFDFREVYWNSRLHTEHERLVALFNPDEGIIADVFAGVGPFAIPAAKKGCAVLANDLNPNSVKWLKQNISDNNVSDNLRISCEDGRDFIRASVLRAVDEPFPPYIGPKASKRELKERRKLRHSSNAGGELVESRNADEKPRRNRVAHFVMNLPDSAIEFLDAFSGVLSYGGRDLSGVYETMPMVHCHCFTRFLDAAEARADIKKRVDAALGTTLNDFLLHVVRRVAPNKDMYCISFRLPSEIAFK